MDKDEYVDIVFMPRRAGKNWYLSQRLARFDAVRTVATLNVPVETLILWGEVGLFTPVSGDAIACRELGY